MPRASLERGFTLIELLIVISIIGVLAAVLLPNLLNARVSAHTRSVQAHSATVYKVAHAIEAEEVGLTPALIAAEIQSKCGVNTSTLIVSGKTFSYGWTPPAALSSCTVSVVGNGFQIVVQGNTLANSRASTNGQSPL